MKFVKPESRSKSNFLLLFLLFSYNRFRLKKKEEEKKKSCKLGSFLEYQKMNWLSKVVSYSFAKVIEYFSLLCM